MLVYNGEGFVERALRSLAVARDAAATVALDTLVLDDASPAPGWSARVAGTCAELGISYYRSPRNLGIPRNMNLALLEGLAERYDYVLLLNSDLVVPANLGDGLVAAARSAPQVGSVTAWSNNASIFSLPVEADFVAEQQRVSALSAALAGSGLPATAPLPVAVGFCMLLPREAIEMVGLFDPVFGRGYCEEIDWSLRSHQTGLRSLLAPGVFVHHLGSGSTRPEGLLPPGGATVDRHEAIIDERYPTYRSELQAFSDSGAIATLCERATTAVALGGMRERGYVVVLGDGPPGRTDLPVVRCSSTRPPRTAEVRWLGLGATITLSTDDLFEGLAGLVGRPATAVHLTTGVPADLRRIAHASVAAEQVCEDVSYPIRAL